MRRQWFESWFDSPYYHELYRDRNEEEAREFINCLLQLLDPLPAARFLDLACGRGRHSLYLATLGYEVVGLDLSELNIEYARQFENERLSFYQHDMRKPFRVNYFDYVVNFFTSFGYFESEKDHIKTLASMYAGLKDEGKCMIDFLNSHRVIEEMKPEGAERMRRDGTVFNISKKEEEGYIIKDIEVKKNNKSMHFQERIRAFTLSDFKRMFRQTGFDLCDVYGNYDLSPYRRESSERLIMIACK